MTSPERYTQPNVGGGSGPGKHGRDDKPETGARYRDGLSAAERLLASLQKRRSGTEHSEKKRYPH